MNKFIAYRNILLNYAFKLLPIRKKQIYCCSFHGQYGDSPRRISEELKKQYPDVRIIWEIGMKSNEIIPDYIVKVKPFSTKSVLYRSMSKITIDNYLGWSYGYENVNSFKLKLVEKQKKKGQFGIATWHGTPLKHISIDEKQYIGKNVMFYSMADLLMCNSFFMKKLYDRINFRKIPILMSGTPRNDILFINKKDRNIQLRKKLELPVNKKIILYAPTFRADNLKMGGLSQIESFDFEKLFSALEEKFNGEWCFVFRAHDSVVELINKRGIKETETFKLGNKGDDMAEYLYVSDVLLTDYSSSFFDYSLCKRPCFLYCPDLEHYKNVERGLYFSMDDLPFPLAMNPDALYQCIKDFDMNKYQYNIDSFLESLGNIEDGNATVKIMKVIKKIMED